MTLTFWHICNASSVLDFARSTWCLSTPVQSVKKLLCPNPNWTSTTLSGMRKRNVTNVEICSKKETLQGTVKSIWTKILCSHAKYVQRLLTERIICTHMLSNAMMSHCHRSNTNVMTVRKHFLNNVTWRSTWILTQQHHESSANTVKKISLQKLICNVMWGNVTQHPRY